MIISQYLYLNFHALIGSSMFATKWQMQEIGPSMFGPLLECINHGNIVFLLLVLPGLMSVRSITSMTNFDGQYFCRL